MQTRTCISASGQPALGTEIPWLPDPSDRDYNHGTGGSPVPMTYHISWPTDAPELKLGQTLTVATHGLPDVWNQLSVEVCYDQSDEVHQRPSVLLFDPRGGHRQQPGPGGDQ